MSSSSEEDLSKFNEATDVKLFNNSLFAEDKGQPGAASAKVPEKSSLRYLDTPNDNRSDLKVTPGFQKHVATQLMKILDSTLDQNITESANLPEHDSNGNCTSVMPTKQPEGGIKLFGASAAFLRSCNISPPPPVKRRKRGRKTACISSDTEDSSSNEAGTSLTAKERRKKNSATVQKSFDPSRKLGVTDEADLSERFAACAVSSEWILNGEAVKAWAPSHKNKEPIQGEATPDLIKMISSMSYRNPKSNKKKKHKHADNKGKINPLKGLSKTIKPRGSRGGKKGKKKDIYQAIQSIRESLGKSSRELQPPKQKKRVRSSHIYNEIKEIFKRPDTPVHCQAWLQSRAHGKQCELSENDLSRMKLCSSSETADLSYKCRSGSSRRCSARGSKEDASVEQSSGASGENVPEAHTKNADEPSENSYENLDEGESLGTTSNDANGDKSHKKKNKVKHTTTCKLARIENSLNIILKKLKEEKRRKKSKNEWPQAVVEDEGFDSDPTKTEKLKKKQRRLIKAHLKLKMKSEKKWNKKMEYLSKDLDNLMMSNVKED